MYVHKIQHVTNYPNKALAIAALEGIREQIGCEGARVLPNHGGKGWRVQAFFPSPEFDGMLGQDGARLVAVPESIILDMRNGQQGFAAHVVAASAREIGN